MFRPGDVVFSVNTGAEMAVERIMAPGVYRCSWSVESEDEIGWISHTYTDEFEEAALTLVSRRDDNGPRGWRAPDRC